MSALMSAAHTHVRAGAATRLDRGLWSALAAASLSVLAIARLLHPDARGFGTHVQLGLPPCGFLALTGVPCPACGLTTAFAHLARGQLALALHANAFGVILFACVLASLPLAVWARARNRAFFETFARMHVERIGLALLLIGFAYWLVRVACLLLG